MKKLESLKNEKFFSKEGVAKNDLKFIVAGTQIQTGETKGLDSYSYEWTSATKTDVVYSADKPTPITPPSTL